MNGLPASLHAVIDTPDCSGGGDDRRPGLRMLDGSDGPARLMFESASRQRHTALLDRWLAIVRVQPTAACGARVVWVLDARTIRWSGGLPPSELHRGMTGLNSEETPILWFRADSGVDTRRGFTAPGVFEAAGIVDAARVRVAARRLRRQVRLRVSIDPEMWGLSASAPSPEDAAIGSVPRLTITASGALRPLELPVVRQWLLLPPERRPKRPQQPRTPGAYGPGPLPRHVASRWPRSSLLSRWWSSLTSAASFSTGYVMLFS